MVELQVELDRTTVPSTVNPTSLGRGGQEGRAPASVKELLQGDPSVKERLQEYDQQTREMIRQRAEAAAGIFQEAMERDPEWGEFAVKAISALAGSMGLPNQERLSLTAWLDG